MTPWVRAATVLLIVVGAGGVVVPYGGERAYGAEQAYRVAPSPGATAPVSASPSAAAPSGSPAPSASVPAHAPARASASASDSDAPSPSAAVPSRAGSRAGEGRERPGRRDPLESERMPEDEEAQDTDDGADNGADGGFDAEADGGVPLVPEAPRETVLVPSAPPRHGVDEAVEHRAGPRLQILPLGSGLILVGLGLGLAFVALRMRRRAS